MKSMCPHAVLGHIAVRYRALLGFAPQSDCRRRARYRDTEGSLEKRVTHQSQLSHDQLLWFPTSSPRGLLAGHIVKSGFTFHPPRLVATALPTWHTHGECIRDRYGIPEGPARNAWGSPPTQPALSAVGAPSVAGARALCENEGKRTAHAPSPRLTRRARGLRRAERVNAAASTGRCVLFLARRLTDVTRRGEAQSKGTAVDADKSGCVSAVIGKPLRASAAWSMLIGVVVA